MSKIPSNPSATSPAEKRCGARGRRAGVPVMHTFRDKAVRQQLIVLAAARVSRKQLCETFRTPSRTIGLYLANHSFEIKQRRRDFLLSLGAEIGLNLPTLSALVGLPLADVRVRLTRLLQASEQTALPDLQADDNDGDTLGAAL